MMIDSWSWLAVLILVVLVAWLVGFAWSNKRPGVQQFVRPARRTYYAHEEQIRELTDQTLAALEAAARDARRRRAHS